MTATFCGHGDTIVSSELQEWLKQNIIAQIEAGTTVFYLGGYGAFDRAAASAVWEIKKTYLDLEHEIYGESEGSHGFDFKDGFDIVFEFKAYRGLESVLHCFAFEKNDSYYIIDDRPDHGRIIREIDEAFYGKLSALFE